MSLLTKSFEKTPADVVTKNKQVVVSICANAGGVGKTTLSVHIGYEMSRRGFNVALIDLDSNGSINLFCGLSRNPKAQDTIAAVFAESFNGVYPFVTPEWGEPKGKLQVCQGGAHLSKVADELSTRKRREYILADRLSDYPLPHDLVILDCPATLGSFNDAALAVSTHLLIPVELRYKSVKGSIGLLEWYRASCKELRLNPPPKILGFVPSKYDSGEAAQRKILKELPQQLQQIKICCYKEIRYSTEFNNASGKGLPLHLSRRNHDAVNDFATICDDLTNIICEEV